MLEPMDRHRVHHRNHWTVLVEAGCCNEVDVDFAGSAHFRCGSGIADGLGSAEAGSE